MAKIRYVKDNEWGTTFPNFRKEEFRCFKHCNGFPSEVAYSLLEVMQNLRNKYGSIHIHSGVRCKQYNAELNGSSAESDHLQGCACDWCFDSHIFEPHEKENIMAYIRTLPNVKYTYTNQTNMYNGIHISVNPTYEDEPKVSKPVEENKDVVQVHVLWNDTMRCRTTPEIKDNNVIGFLTAGFYNVLEEKHTDYHWCKVAKDNWVACVGDACIYVPIEIKEEMPEIQEKEENNINTPTDTETSENKQENSKIEHVEEEVKEEKENVLVWLIEMLAKFIKNIYKLFKKD